MFEEFYRNFILNQESKRLVSPVRFPLHFDSNIAAPNSDVIVEDNALTITNKNEKTQTQFIVQSENEILKE